MPAAKAWPSGRRITIHDIQAATDRVERWSMLTSYDILNAQLTVKAVPDHVADMPASPARRERRAGAAECDQCAAAAGQGITALMYLPGIRLGWSPPATSPHIVVR